MVTEQQVSDYLEQIAASNVMGRSARRSELLEFLIRKEFSGDGDSLKAYSIGLDVFGKSEAFDPSTDSSVRVEIGRLRTALTLFEASEYATSELIVEIPVGTYRPKFFLRDNVEVATPGPVELETQTSVLGSSSFRAEKTTGWSLKRTALAAGVLLLLVGLFFGMQQTWGPTLNTRGKPIDLVVDDLTGDDIGKSIATLIKSSFANNSVVQLQDALIDNPGHIQFRVHGSVTNYGGRTVINTELVNEDMRTVVWNKSFRLSQGDDFERVVNQSLLGELQTRLFGEVKRSLETQDPADLTPEQLFVLATWVSGPAVNSMEWETERVSLMKIALEKDPDFGPAHSVLADKYGFLANVYEPWDTKENRDQSLFHADRASELSPLDANAMFNVAQSHWHAGRMAQSQRIFKRVTELDESNSLAQLFSVVVPYWCDDVPDEIMDFAIEFDRNLSADDPIRWIVLTWIATLHTNRGEFKLALKAATDAAQIFQVGYTYMAHAMLLNKLGEVDEATRVIQRQQSNWPNIGPQHYAEMTVPRQCHEQADPSRIIAHYNDLSISTKGKFERPSAANDMK